MKTLESRLYTLRLLPRSAVDGRYRAATWLAVKRFQRAHGLRATGNINPTTWYRVAVAYRDATTPPRPRHRRGPRRRGRLPG